MIVRFLNNGMRLASCGGTQRVSGASAASKGTHGAARVLRSAPAARGACLLGRALVLSLARQRVAVHGV